jgi:hypothetical protein
MQLIAFKFFAALAGNGNLTAATVTLLADLYSDHRRVRTARRSLVHDLRKKPLQVSTRAGGNP